MSSLNGRMRSNNLIIWWRVWFHFWYLAWNQIRYWCSNLSCPFYRFNSRLILLSFVIRYWLKYAFQKFKLTWTTLFTNKKLLWKCHWMINEWTQQIRPNYDRFPNPSGRLTTILVPVLKFLLETGISPTQIIVRDRIKWGFEISWRFFCYKLNFWKNSNF